LIFNNQEEFDNTINGIYSQLVAVGDFLYIDYSGEYVIINKNTIKEIETYTSQTGFVNFILEQIKEISGITELHKAKADKDFFFELSTTYTKERFVVLQEMFNQLMRGY
jgi:hypothetical protein